MPAREPIFLGDECALANRWLVSEDTMRRVVKSAEEFFFETRTRAWIISGYRTAAEQAALGRRGRPAARDDLSTHRSCPATGVDVSLGLAPGRARIAAWGRIVTLNGLRWGGGSPPDEFGIPSDWGHVDRGPRRGAP